MTSTLTDPKTRDGSQPSPRRRTLSKSTSGLLLGSLLASVLASACVEQNSDAVPSDEEVNAARSSVVLPAAPTPRYPSGAVLEGEKGARVVYLGADIDTDVVTAGKPFNITHYFKVEQPPPAGWKLFVHLDGVTDKRHHLNADHVPAGGKYPIAVWRAGDIIKDQHRVSVPPTWPADKVTIYVGLWKGNARFKVSSGNQDGMNRALVTTLPVQGENAKPPPPPKRLIVRKLKAGQAITLDGKLDEAAWNDAASTGPFVGTMDGSAPQQASSAKALWDSENLYVAFDFQDSDVWGTLDKHDDKLWTQEAAELFIDADGDQQTYVELQVSPRNVTFDSWLPAYRQNDNAWDAPMKTAVQVSGTLDKRGDKDTGWTVEMQIPLAAVKGRLAQMKNVPPQPGTEWRANLFRMDLPSGKPQQASAWSPPLLPDFHALSKFGTFVFADENGTVPAAPTAPTTPPASSEAAAAAPHPLSPVLQRAALKDPNGPMPAPAGAPAAAVGTPALPQGAPPAGPEQAGDKSGDKAADKPAAKPAAKSAKPAKPAAKPAP
ncbi:MAG: carbohydrate-binding family 9-like protein [Polyangia bacterium]